MTEISKEEVKVGLKLYKPVSSRGNKLSIVFMIISVIGGAVFAGCIGGDDSGNSKSNGGNQIQDRNPLMPSGTLPDAYLEITGYGLNLNYSFKQLANRTDLVNRTFNMVNEIGEWTNSTYVGVPLTNLIGNFTPAEPDAGFIRFSAADGYSKKIAWPLLQKYAGEGNETVIALAMNGSFIAGNKGPIRVVCSALQGSYWVGNLTKIEFIPWELKVSFPGMSARTYNVSILKTLENTTTNFTKNDVATQYTGINLTVLAGDAGFILNSSHTLIFRGMDGYEARLNWSEIETTYLQNGNASLIAFAANGTALWWSEKGPLMLVAPGFAGNKQVRNLVAIEVVENQ
ncbi:MAG: molybdopterin-dependent oxidoreductase [Thermoplasmata archaeon]